MFTLGDVLRDKAERQSDNEEFTIVQHLGVPGTDGLYNEVERVTCPHTASKQFDRYRWSATPLVASLAMFRGDELVKFWSPTAL